MHSVTARARKGKEGNSRKKIGIHLFRLYDAEHFALDEIQHLFPLCPWDALQTESVLGVGGGSCEEKVLRGFGEPELEQLFGPFKRSLRFGPLDGGLLCGGGPAGYCWRSSGRGRWGWSYLCGSRRCCCCCCWGMVV